MSHIQQGEEGSSQESREETSIKIEVLIAEPQLIFDD